MARRGGNRLKYQVEQAIKAINFIGQSKKELRDRRQETGIHSTTQIKHTLSDAQNFAKWLKDNGVKDLYQLKRKHYREYIAFKREEGVSNGHLINIETSLRLLSKGMVKVSEAKGFRNRDWVPATRIVDVNTREKPVDRSYSRKEIESFRAKVSDDVGQAMDLQLAFGLRLREAAKSKVAHIVENDGKLYWQAVADKNALNNSHGVTKGGRPRITPINPLYEEIIRKMIESKGMDENICEVRYNTLKSDYNRAGLRGSHTLRHTYARQMLLNELRILGIEEEGRYMLQMMIENRKAGYRKDHLVTKKERSLYKLVNECVDRVHAWLGHGRGRIDLCEIYLSGI